MPAEEEQLFPIRGDIYWVDFNPARGSEQAGRRPACVISMDSFNRVMPVVVIAAVTSKVKGSAVALYLPQGQPLPMASEILPFQVLTVDKSRLEQWAGRLNGEQLSQLEIKMKLCWGLR